MIFTCKVVLIFFASAGTVVDLDETIIMKTATYRTLCSIVQDCLPKAQKAKRTQKQKACYFLNSRLSLLYLGWLKGLEPSTTGITILIFLYSAVLIKVVQSI